MQVFEFHFNPKLKSDLIFDSFCYEPENIYEKRMGSLYMVGLLKNVLPQNIRFIEKLTKVIKDKYYRSTIFKSEKSLKESLKVANEFLEGITKKGDVSWLGNLSFAAISLASRQKPRQGMNLNFTKVGEIKFLLLRGNRIIDINKKLKLQEIEPYPLKVFGNIVSAKLAEDDLILVFTQEVFEFFQNQNLLDEIAKLSSFSAKGLKGILNGKKEKLSKVSGVCLAIFLTKEALLEKRETISPQVLKKFSFKEVFSPALKFFKRIKKIRFYPSIFTKAPAKKVRKRAKRFKLPRIEVPKVPILEVFRTKIKSPVLNKKIILIGSLITFLVLGFILFQIEQRQKISIYQENLKTIQEKLDLAESFLLLENPRVQEKANILLKESWKEISPILKEIPSLPKSFSNQVLALKDKIVENLYQLNKLVEIQTPELVFEFKPKGFVPQKMAVSNSTLYFFSPYSPNLFSLKENNETEIIEIGQNINLATKLNDGILFLSKSFQPFLLKTGEDKPNQLKTLEGPDYDFSFNDLSSFNKNLYFFDKKSGQIIKYSYRENFEWENPKFWLKKAIVGNSITIDGSIWVLGKSSIEEYYTGEFQEKIEPDIFPNPKDFSKIFTSSALPYLYILEPIQKRIVILDKAGKIIKQFQSEKFDNLLDFGVSENGKTIWLLNGLKVYKVEF